MRKKTTSDFTKRIQRDRLREALGALGMPERLPPDFTQVYEGVPVYADRVSPVPWTMLRVVVRDVTVTGRKSSRHRVFVVCGCNRQIPAGRMHQHAAACKGVGRTPGERGDGLWI